MTSQQQLSKVRMFQTEVSMLHTRITEYANQFGSIHAVPITAPLENLCYAISGLRAAQQALILEAYRLEGVL